MTSIFPMLFIVWLISISGFTNQSKTDYLNLPKKVDAVNNETVGTTTIICYKNVSNKYVVVNDYMKDMIDRPDMFRVKDCN